jgi:hypothetical protein
MIEVVRVLRYQYEDAERMTEDMGRWGVGAQASRRQGNMIIQSTIFLPELVASNAHSSVVHRIMDHLARVLPEGPDYVWEQVQEAIEDGMAG